MIRMNPPRLDHLKRLTDSRGLMHSAMGECPDRFSGYRAVDNADALRLCANVSDAVQGDQLVSPAKTYFDYLWRSRQGDGRVHHACDARGQWSSHEDDALVQSRLARALAAVIVSELPIALRLKAADWWREILPFARHSRSAASAANWLIAIGQLREADPGRDLALVRELADWIIEERFERNRAAGWEWFEPAWSPGAACMAEGLWYAARMLDDSRCAQVASVTTQFLADRVFDGNVLVPPGTAAPWSSGQAKPCFDQLSLDAAALAELFATAEWQSASGNMSRLAELAARWFAGNNVLGLTLVDEMSGACRDGLTARGPAADCGAPAAVSYLLVEAGRAARAARIAEPPVYMIPINC